MIKKLMGMVTNTVQPDACPVYDRKEYRCVLICSGVPGYNRTRTYYYSGTTLCYTTDASACGCVA